MERDLRPSLNFYFQKISVFIEIRLWAERIEGEKTVLGRGLVSKMK